MASGFFLGGLSEGFQAEQRTANQAKYQQGILQLEQQRLQQQQHNELINRADKERATLIQGITDFADAYNVAHQNDPPEQRTKAISQAVSGYKQMLMQQDKILGRDPSSTDAQIATIAAMPPKTQTARAMAEATGTYGKEQAQTSEANARARVLNQAADQNAPPSSNPDLDTETQLGGKQFKSSGNARVDNIIKGVDNGDLPPVVSGNVSYKDRTAFASGIEANGINLVQKQLQWKQAEKLVQSLNGPQMIKYVGLNKSVQGTIDEALRLSRQMQLGGVPALNSLELKKYIKTQGNSPQGQLATQYVGVINTLKEEFANLANGGYAPTDPAWKLAEEQINGDYGWQQLPATLLETKKLINIRLHAIPGMDTVGPGAKNQYTGGSPAQFDNDFKPVPGFPGVTVRQVQ